MLERPVLASSLAREELLEDVASRSRMLSRIRGRVDVAHKYDDYEGKSTPIQKRVWRDGRVNWTGRSRRGSDRQPMSPWESYAPTVGVTTKWESMILRI